MAFNNLFNTVKQHKKDHRAILYLILVAIGAPLILKVLEIYKLIP
jgi:hypothetical protein